MVSEQIKISKLHANTGQIPGLPANPRSWTKEELNKIAQSLRETPELFGMRPIIVYPFEDGYVVLGGNLRLAGAKKNKDREVPCIVVPEDTPVEKLKEIVIKDNGSFGEWDFDALANEWDDLSLTEWGVPAWDGDVAYAGPEGESEEDEIARKEREFKEKMEAGEISEDDPEYLEFLEKFKQKKTTDDCYTPDVVYDAVADWVAKEYGVSRANFVRPFYPGGDYQSETYKSTDIVVDNPPFSILSEILNFYTERRIRFFLFAPHLTLFSSSSSSSSCVALPVGVPVTYANGANVNTSFLTNLGDMSIRAKSSPSLYQAVKVANDANLAQMRRELPKYAYDHHILTTPFFEQLSRLGIEFEVPVAESEPISRLDAQRDQDKGIFGKGYIVSDRIFAEREKAEREKAEREKAEREKAERWELSDRELMIVAKLNAKRGTR